MCDPVTALALGGSALSAGSSLFSGLSGSSAAKLQAQIARGNADILEQNAKVARGEADLAVKRGAFEAGRLGQQVDRVLGSQVARFAAGHLDPRAGSPLLLQAFTAAQGETDKGLINAQAGLDAAGFLGKAASQKIAALGEQGTALALESKGDMSLVAGVLGAGTALINGLQKWPGLSSGKLDLAGAFSI